MSSKALEVGDRVNWMRSSRGGYGYITPVAAVVLKIGLRRIQVRVARRIALVWQLETRWVDPCSLKPRVAYVPEVDVEKDTGPAVPICRLTRG